MSCTKAQIESYQIHKDHEYANISLRCWDNPPPAGSTRGMYYGGEILIHSSFGSWGNTWTACGCPFKKFLLDTEFDYFFGKLMGTDLDEFDGEGSIKSLRRTVKRERRSRSLDKEDARALWDGIDECENQARCSTHDWVYAMQSLAESLRLDRHVDASRLLDEPWYLTETRHKPSAVRFWQVIWPEFTSALRADLSAAAEVATC